MDPNINQIRFYVKYNYKKNNICSWSKVGKGRKKKNKLVLFYKK